MSKYEPLGEFLGRLDAQHWRPTFHELERLIGSELPASARKRAAWWGNGADAGAHAKMWMDNGWTVEKVDLPKQVVSFVKGNGMNGNGAGDANGVDQQDENAVAARAARVAGQARRTAQAAKDWAGEVPGRAAEVVRARPAAALGAGAGLAFAAGLVIGLMLIPRRSREDEAVELRDDQTSRLLGALKGAGAIGALSTLASLRDRVHVPEKAVAAAQHKAEDALSSLRQLMKSVHLPDGAAEAARDRAEDALHALKDGLKDLRHLARERFGR